MTSPFSLENEVFAKFAFYGAVVLGKTAFMSLWTARHRLPRKVFPSPEDYKSLGKAPPSQTTDAVVERVRRCHQNDLENILPFVLIGLLFVAVEPDYNYAVMLFRVFTVSRLLHTVVYLNAVPQPSRVIAFVVGQGVLGLMLKEIFSKVSF